MITKLRQKNNKLRNRLEKIPNKQNSNRDFEITAKILQQKELGNKTKDKYRYSNLDKSNLNKSKIILSPNGNKEFFHLL